MTADASLYISEYLYHSEDHDTFMRYVDDDLTVSIGGENVIVPATELKRMNYEGRLDEGLDSLTAEMPKFAAR